MDERAFYSSRGSNVDSEHFELPRIRAPSLSRLGEEPPPARQRSLPGSNGPFNNESPFHETRPPPPPTGPPALGWNSRGGGARNESSGRKQNGRNGNVFNDLFDLPPVSAAPNPERQRTLSINDHAWRRPMTSTSLSDSDDFEYAPPPQRPAKRKARSRIESRASFEREEGSFLSRNRLSPLETNAESNLVDTAPCLDPRLALASTSFPLPRESTWNPGDVLPPPVLLGSEDHRMMQATAATAPAATVSRAAARNRASSMVEQQQDRREDTRHDSFHSGRSDADSLEQYDSSHDPRLAARQSGGVNNHHHHQNHPPAEQPLRTQNAIQHDWMSAPWLAASDFTGGLVNGDLLRSVNPVWGENSGHRSIPTSMPYSTTTPFDSARTTIASASAAGAAGAASGGSVEAAAARGGSRKAKKAKRVRLMKLRSHAEIEKAVIQLPVESEALLLLARLCFYKGPDDNVPAMRQAILDWKGYDTSLTRNADEDAAKATYTEFANKLMNSADPSSITWVKYAVGSGPNSNKKKTVEFLFRPSYGGVKKKFDVKPKTPAPPRRHIQSPSVHVLDPNAAPSDSGALLFHPSAHSNDAPPSQQQAPPPSAQVRHMPELRMPRASKALSSSMHSSGRTRVDLRSGTSAAGVSNGNGGGGGGPVSSALTSGSRGMVTPSPWFTPGTVARAHFRVLSDLLRYKFLEPESAFDEPLSAPVAIELFAAADLASPRKAPRLILNNPLQLMEENVDDTSRGWIDVQVRCRPCRWNAHPREWAFGWPFPSKAVLHMLSSGTFRGSGASEVVQLTQALRYTNGKTSGKDKATSLLKSMQRLRKHARNRVALMDLVLERGSGAAQYDTATHFVIYVQRVFIRSTAAMMRDIGSQSLARMRKFESERSAGAESGSLVPVAAADGANFDVPRGVCAGLSDEDAAAQLKIERAELMGSMVQDGIEIDTIRLSLKCPLSLTRIRTPARGARCRHPQCFDLESYLEYSRKSYGYTCPVCSEADFCHPNVLIVSSLFSRALGDFANEDEIEVLPSGRFRVPLPPEQQQQKQQQQQRQTQRGAEVLDANSGQASGQQQQHHQPQKLVATKHEARAALEPNVVIDLTLDDDDDDDDGQDVGDSNGGMAGGQNQRGKGGGGAIDVGEEFSKTVDERRSGGYFDFGAPLEYNAAVHAGMASGFAGDFDGRPLWRESNSQARAANGNNNRAKNARVFLDPDEIIVLDSD